MINREKLLRIEDVAEWTGISKPTLRYYRAHQRGPKSAKLGRRVVYREADVQAWIDEQLNATAAPSVA